MVRDIYRWILKTLFQTFSDPDIPLPLAPYTLLNKFYRVIKKASEIKGKLNSNPIKTQQFRIDSPAIEFSCFSDLISVMRVTVRSVCGFMSKDRIN